MLGGSATDGSLDATVGTSRTTGVGEPFVATDAVTGAEVSEECAMTTGAGALLVAIDDVVGAEVSPEFATAGPEEEWPNAPTAITIAATTVPMPRSLNRRLTREGAVAPVFVHV